MNLSSKMFQIVKKKKKKKKQETAAVAAAAAATVPLCHVFVPQTPSTSLCASRHPTTHPRPTPPHPHSPPLLIHAGFAARYQP